MKIKNIMSKKLIVCSIKDSVDTLSKLMRENNVGFVLVMNRNKLYGVITDRDLALNIGINLKDICRCDVISIDENKDLGNALDTMRTNKIKRLVVTSGNKVTGVLSLSDIISSDVDCSTLLEVLREIYFIDRNDEEYDVDVDDFVL